MTKPVRYANRVQISLRFMPDEAEAVRRACEVLGQSQQVFIMRAAMKEAERVTPRSAP